MPALSLPTEIWCLVLPYLTVASGCRTRAVERTAYHATCDRELLQWKKRLDADHGEAFALMASRCFLHRISQLQLHSVSLATGALILSRALSISSTLLFVDLTNCGISDVGGAAVVRATKNVTTLVLNSNPLGPICAFALMTALQEDAFLHLGLDNVGFQDDEVRMLCWGIFRAAPHCSLDFLGLCKNTFVPVSNFALAFAKQDSEQQLTISWVDHCGRKSCMDHPKFLKLYGNVAPNVEQASANLPSFFRVIVPNLLEVTTTTTIESTTKKLSRNERRRLPLVDDVTCSSCGATWLAGSITLSQCETFRSLCKLHGKTCTNRWQFRHAADVLA